MIYDFGELTLSKFGSKETFYITVDGDMFVSTNYMNMPTHSKVGKINVIHDGIDKYIIGEIADYLISDKIIFSEKICGDILYSWNL